MAGFGAVFRRARRASRRGDDAAQREAVLPLSASIEALGEQSWTDEGVVDVPVDRIVGTVSRVDDFDRGMRPLRPHLRSRWEDVAGVLASGRGLPPVRLVQLGELYFVVDGHHRVSVSRAKGMAAVEARVRRLCTVAYACHCLTLLDLPNKAAERRFLEQYPLPDDARAWLWLDDPGDWERIEQAARRWLDEHLAADGGDGSATAEELLEEWWRHDVLPTAHACRGAERVWLEDYLCAVRDRTTGGCCLV
ncbi:MAG: hypothetical protein GEV10_28825 [Streptosporangiales bacterium]|nr:hypothetical protein [Streptosporangiales bacterium]